MQARSGQNHCLPCKNGHPKHQTLHLGGFLPTLHSTQAKLLADDPQLLRPGGIKVWADCGSKCFCFDKELSGDFSNEGVCVIYPKPQTPNPEH